MPRLPEPVPAAIAFQPLAEIAVGATTRIDLCRVAGPQRRGELIAVKRLHPHIAEDPGFSTQFLDEVWMTAALKHPNVVQVAGWGNDAQGSYLAVELVQGVSLARLMKTVFETGEAFPERLVVYIADMLCRGLAAAHALRSREGEFLNLVHRDLTPGNVLIGFKGEVKIADFGMAKAKMRMTQTLTGMLKGEPTYMAPEQARGHDVDRRADLFAVGVMLFELFAGRHPWTAATDYETAHLAATAPPPDLRELRPKIDKELVTVVLRCLEKVPGSRYQSADEIQARLDEWLHAHGYMEGSQEALGRFVRRNAMRQMRWFERAIAGELSGAPEPLHGGAAAPAAAGRPAPRVPTYTNTGGAIAKALLTKKKGRAPPAADEESTDITENIAAKVAALHGRGPPVIREVADERSEDAPTGEINEWGEDPPTAVHNGGRARDLPPPPALEGPSADPSMADDESDLRTTAVKVLRGPTRLPGATTSRLPVSADFEPEEAPTLPMKGDTGPRPIAVMPPQQAQPQPQRRPAPPPPPVRSQPPPRPPPSTPPFAPPARPSASGPPPSGIQALSAPPGMAGPGALRRNDFDDDLAPRSGAAARGAPMQAAEDRLRSESERLAKEAARLHEEARVAAAQAERKASMAKVAAHAAVIANEALRMAATAGPQEASRRLEEALALEASVQRAAATPLSLPPEGVARGFDPPPKTPFPPSVPPGSVPVPSLSTPAFPVVNATQRLDQPPPTSRLPAGLPPAAPGMPVQPSYLRPRQDAPVMPVPAQPPAAAYSTGLDALQFRSRLQPMFFGMPRAFAIIVAIVVFLVVLGLLFAFCSTGG